MNKFYFIMRWKFIYHILVLWMLLMHHCRGWICIFVLLFTIILVNENLSEWIVVSYFEILKSLDQTNLMKYLMITKNCAQICFTTFHIHTNILIKYVFILPHTLSLIVITVDSILHTIFVRYNCTWITLKTGNYFGVQNNIPLWTKDYFTSRYSSGMMLFISKLNEWMNFLKPCMLSSTL